MTNFEIDRLLQHTPCLCGDITTWHKECYRGKTDEEVREGYRKVYSRIRRQLAKLRKEASVSLTNLLSMNEERK